MTVYVPGTGETDSKKQNMSLQALGAAQATDEANIATNTTNIATNTTNIATNTAAIAALIPVTKSQQQTGTNNTAFATPLHQQDHDSAAKAWGTATISAGVLTNGGNNYGGSWARSSAGVYVFTFTTAFTSASAYSAFISGTNIPMSFITSGAHLAGSIGITCWNTSFAAADANQIDVVCFGRQ